MDDETVSREEAVPPAASVTLVGLREAVSPAGAEVESVTVPLNLLMLVRVIVEVADEPDAIVRLAGAGEMRKSFAGFVRLQVSLYVPTTGTNLA